MYIRIVDIEAFRVGERWYLLINILISIINLINRVTRYICSRLTLVIKCITIHLDI